ncbi:MAG: Transglutaminase-like protein family protein [candidate division WS6 bacterium GW2011_GWD1_35_594]|nr:MAG: Transglutaminase-like protein family protein [candidate division WS6 bacterium GW2011_GWD1_35_594]
MRLNAQNFFKIFLTFSFLLISYKGILAQSSDFVIQNNTTLTYTTGSNVIDFTTEYIREVMNKKYLYSTQGEKIFHIPDLPQTKEYEVEIERQFKLDSLTVTDEKGKAILYTVEELELGDGIYVKVPNYKQTIYGSPYRIYVRYKTHDLVKMVNDWVLIQSHALNKDTIFEQIDPTTGTKTALSYNLKVVTDATIPPLAKIYPSTYRTEENDEKTIYYFDSKDRLGQSIYLEFGTQQLYRFELKYTAPKTDEIVPERYSDVISALSTNIYELSLPRELSETNQKVKIEKIIPTPTRITMDEEGNINAKFEVPANQSTDIYISGYIWVEQNSLINKREIPNLEFTKYVEDISKDSKLSKYTSATKYWEVNDPFIVEEARKLATDKTYLMDIVRSDYKYVNEILEYDQSKIAENNQRIGAKAALQGGGSVCMEYADSMIALLRAQGIPARAALGYANLDVLSKTNESGNVRHQWVQIWVPEYGWLSIDPTYESDNMKIGQDIEGILWETFYDQELSSVRMYSADTVSSEELSDYKIQIYAVTNEDIKDENSLLSYSDITFEAQNSTGDIVNTLIKTTTVGKALIVVLPISIVLVLLIALASLTTSLIRRAKYRKASRTLQP